MRQLFKIDESEKKRILEMHENATKKNYLMEQGTKGCLSPNAVKQLNNFLTKVPQDKLCNVLSQITQTSVANNFIGEFLYKSITAMGTGSETGPPGPDTKSNAGSEVTFYTLAPYGRIVELFQLRFYANKTGWEVFNNFYDEEYAGIQSDFMLNDIKQDKSPTRMKSVELLTKIIENGKQLGTTVMAQYFKNLLETLPDNDIRKQTFNLAITEAKKNDKGNQLAQQLGF